MPNNTCSKRSNLPTGWENHPVYVMTYSSYSLLGQLLDCIMFGFTRLNEVLVVYQQDQVCAGVPEGNEVYLTTAVVSVHAYDGLHCVDVHTRIQRRLRVCVCDYFTSCLPFMRHTRISFLLDSHVRFCPEKKSQLDCVCPHLSGELLGLQVYTCLFMCVFVSALGFF